MLQSISLKRLQWLGGGAIVFLFLGDVIIKQLLKKNILTISYTVNEYATLSLPISNSILIVVTFLIIVFLTGLLFYNLYHSNTILALLLFGIILGALSNFFDRLFSGGVIDYIFFIKSFPVFNLSDVLITISIVFLFFYYLFQEYHVT